MWPWTSLSLRPKTNPSADRFLYRLREYWKRYTWWMRSRDKTKHEQSMNHIFLQYVAAGSDCTCNRPGSCTCSSIHPFDLYGCCKYLFHVLHSCMQVLIAGRKLLTRGLLCQLLQQPVCNKCVHSNQVTILTLPHLRQINCPIEI